MAMKRKTTARTSQYKTFGWFGVKVTKKGGRPFVKSRKVSQATS